jgi:hypothetical protein
MSSTGRKLVKHGMEGMWKEMTVIFEDNIPDLAWKN